MSVLNALLTRQMLSGWQEDVGHQSQSIITSSVQCVLMSSYDSLRNTATTVAYSSRARNHTNTVMKLSSSLWSVSVWGAPVDPPGVHELLADVTTLRLINHDLRSQVKKTTNQSRGPLYHSRICPRELHKLSSQTEAALQGCGKSFLLTETRL